MWQQRGEKKGKLGVSDKERREGHFSEYPSCVALTLRFIEMNLKTKLLESARMGEEPKMEYK